jgi:hypothetical protein
MLAQNISHGLLLRKVTSHMMSHMTSHDLYIFLSQSIHRSRPSSICITWHRLVLPCLH